ncbi:MAG: aminodeoxychorismate/anthranilate synthase component II [Bacteroidota bacterium]|nr:aminodeoxychorismate/anthranilate synthase component II [Bacteroidota bacterium]
MRITLFDNHDSFTWNLAHDLERLNGVEVEVVREGSWEDRCWETTEALVLSPGPGLPQERGQLMAVTAQAIERGVPVLGVCLGMQALALHFGGRLLNLEAPLHGRQLNMEVSSDAASVGPLASMWARLNPEEQVGHYHSWVVDASSLPDELYVNARSSQGFPLAMCHKTLPVAGVQFHPESVLTPSGRDLLQGWVEASQRCLAISASNASLNFS